MPPNTNIHLPDVVEEFFSDHEKDRLHELILDCGKVKTFFSNEPLCEAGDRGDCFWLIQTGSVRVKKEDFSRPRVAGEIVGEQAYFKKDTVRSTSLFSEGTSEVLELHFDDVNKTEESKNIFIKLFAASCSNKLSEATDERVDSQAQLISKEKLLIRFVNDFALSEVKKSTLGNNAIKPVAFEGVFLFGDIAGFSDHVKGLDPENTANIVSGIMNNWAQIIEARNGHIDKFMGDGVMAFWPCGSGRSADQCCKDACHAALEMLSYIEANDSQLGARIGLHFGHATAGNFGAADRIAYTFIGDDVNSAARYEQAKVDAEGNTLRPIRISPEVFDRLDIELKDFFNGPKYFFGKHDHKFCFFDGPATESIS